jgi:hypothetical protein
MVPARPTIGVEKLALLCNPASIAAAKAKVLTHLEAWFRGFLEYHLSKVTIVHHGCVIPTNKCVKEKDFN